MVLYRGVATLGQLEQTASSARMLRTHKSGSANFQTAYYSVLTPLKFKSSTNIFIPFYLRDGNIFLNVLQYLLKSILNLWTEKGGYCRNPAEKSLRSNYAVNSLIKPLSSANCEPEFDDVTDILDIGDGVPSDAPKSEKSSTSIITETDTDTEETIDDCTAKY
ncbi:hypothetical protein FQA39_LY10604 [Lamprigera yunnana]|nr:hypothetical protein FQA39_LY10604 [Lamprigera yunnana]